jgi:hypothetical protein
MKAKRLKEIFELIDDDANVYFPGKPDVDLYVKDECSCDEYGYFTWDRILEHDDEVSCLEENGLAQIRNAKFICFG